MTRQESFTLTTAELKEAIHDYINKCGGHYRSFHDINGFGVTQSKEDIREYTTYITYKEVPKDENA